MTFNLRYILPTLASVVLTASFALAQQGPTQRPPRTQPTAEQMEARRQQMCADRGAREAANFTYVEQRLKLTAAQKPLFDRWKAAQESVQAQGQANCGKTPAAAANAANGQRQRPTLTERNTRMEDMLKQRLADLQKTSGPQEALYNSLTDDQKKLFEQRGGRGGFAGRGRGGFRMAFAGRGPGFGGPGFGGRGPGFGPRGQGSPGRSGPNAPTPPAPTRG